MIRIRASQLGGIMGDSRSIDESLLNDEIREIVAKKKRTDDEMILIQSLKDRSLSEGAKTLIKKLAKQHVYGYEERFESKYTDKGLIVEDESISLYNRVMGTNYVKNFDRIENEWITGECDIVDTGKKIIDIKSSWSLNTFPCFSEDCINSDYEWQGRAYMMLWKVPVFENAFCLVSTPEGLIKDGEEDLHNVDGIEEHMRVSVIQYYRDLEIEEKIKIKVDAAKIYFNNMVEKFYDEHNHHQ